MPTRKLKCTYLPSFCSIKIHALFKHHVLELVVLQSKAWIISHNPQLFNDSHIVADVLRLHVAQLVKRV